MLSDKIRERGPMRNQMHDLRYEPDYNFRVSGLACYTSWS